MAFCKNCGVQLADTATFCTNCGTALNAAPNAAPQQPMQQQMQQPAQQQMQQPMQQQMQQQMQQPMQQMQQPNFRNQASAFMPDHTSEFDPADIAKTRGLNVFSYIGMLFLIPVFIFKGSKFARFHINQGLVLFLLSCVFDGFISAIGGIFSLVASAGLYSLYSIGNIVTIVLSVLLYSIIVAYMVIGIINTATGKAKELPLIGKIHIAD